MEWEQLVEQYKTYFNDISQKQKMAHQVAYKILGSSYQLEFTIDYMKYKEKTNVKIIEKVIVIPTNLKKVKRKRKKKVKKENVV